MTYTQPSLFDPLPDSPDLLETLFATGKIALRRGSLFSTPPSSLDLNMLLEGERIEGMLLGVAVGDSLGHSTEWRFDPESRHARFGTILDHLRAPELRTGCISDDAQMTFWTVDRLVQRGAFDFEDMVECFVKRRTQIVGMGSNTSASLTRHLQRLRGEGIEIHDCIGDPESEGRGNGSVMRFSPIVLPHLRAPSVRLWSDATLSAFITHGNTVALASSIAMTALVWKILQRPTGDSPPAEWWLDEFLQCAHDLESAPLPMPLNTDPMPRWMNRFSGTLCDFLDGPVRRAFRSGASLSQACSLDGFGSRADCTQTIPAVLYVLMCHGDSFESAIISSVNDTKDNDSVAAIVGAIVGALHGRRAIRKKWLEGIHSKSLTIDGLESHSDREAMEELCRRSTKTFAAC